MSEIIVSKKSRLIALLLCIIFGALGAHRFYAGKFLSGGAMLLLTITGFGLWLSLLWVLIDCIVIAAGSMSDRDGHIIKNWDTVE